MPLSAPKSLCALSVLALVALQSSPASASAEPDKRTLSLTATGAVKTTPDKVDISTGVTSEAKTAREALDQNTEAMTKVVEALKEDGIDPKDIQTTNFSVDPVYDQRPYDQPKPPVVIGYRVTNQVRISLHDIKGYLHESDLGQLVIARDLLRDNYPTIGPEVPLTEALDQLEPGEIYLASGGEMRCAYWGEILTATAKKRGGGKAYRYFASAYSCSSP